MISVHFRHKKGRRRFVLALCLFNLLAVTPARSHDVPSLIVDTDMAADDARALALLLGTPYYQVLAVVTSDGVCPPDQGAVNITRMLRFLGHAGVPVACGRTLDAPPPTFRVNATGLDWERLGEPILPNGGWSAATNLLRQILGTASAPVTYVCLGPLTTLAETLATAPELVENISAVVWFGSPTNAVQPDWNNRRDMEAVQKISACGVRMKLIRWPEQAPIPALNTALLEELRAVDSPAARLIIRLHGSGRGAELVRAEHLRLWDDLAALWLLEPRLFKTTTVADQPGWTQQSPNDPGGVSRGLINAFHSVLPPRATVVLADFPTELARLLPDLRDQAQEILARHGIEEWKATVLTSELHRHLGTYSIVGAKMGLRARERFNLALDELRVESHAGLKPPLSCVNDGLQVATGASLGRGTISVPTNGTPGCEAVFRYGDRQLRLRLKPGFAQRIAADMAELERRHGGINPAYFQAVRTVSLKHWLDFDRNTMFEETEEDVSTIP